jgi:hypothetical protein
MNTRLLLRIAKRQAKQRRPCVAGCLTHRQLKEGLVLFFGLLCLSSPLTLSAQVTINTVTGSDGCAQINAAQAALPARGGVVDARAIQGVVNCAGTFNVGSTTQGVTLLLGAAEFKVQNSVNVFQGSRLLGISGGSGNAGTTPTIISAGASFPTNSVLLQWNAPGTADGIMVSDLQLNCASVSGCIGMDINNSQDISTVSRVFILNNRGNGIQISGTSQAVGIYDTSVFASSLATTDNCLTIGSTADHVVLTNFGCGNQNVAQSSGAGVLCTSCNIYVEGFHVENHLDGMLFTGSGSGSASVVGINGLGNIANVVRIASTWTGSVVAKSIRKFSATNSVKNDIAAFNHFCLDESLASYELTALPLTGTTQLITTCSSLPSRFRPNFYVGSGDITPDTNTLLHLRGNSINLDGIHIEDTGPTPRKIAFGPGVGGAGATGLRDMTGAKQLWNARFDNSDNRFQVWRLAPNLGTAYSGADAAIVLTSGWGTAPSVSAATGFDQGFSWSVTAGTAPGANPVITVTFKDGTWTNAPQYSCTRNDTATPTPSTFFPTWTTTATALTINMQGTPTGGKIYKFVCMAMGN